MSLFFSRKPHVFAACAVAACLVLPSAGVMAQIVPGGNPLDQRVGQCLTISQQDPEKADRLARALMAETPPASRAHAGAIGCLGTAAQFTANQPRMREAQRAIAALLANPEIAGDVALRLTMLSSALAQSLNESARAMQLANETLRMAVAQNNKIAQLQALAQLGEIHGGLLHNPAGASKYLQQAVDIVRENRIPDPIAYYNLGYHFLNIGRYDDAEAMLRKALEYARNSQVARTMPFRIQSDLALIAAHRGHTEEAQRQLQLAIGKQEGHDPQGEVLSLARLARLQQQAGDIPAAVTTAQRAVKMTDAGAPDDKYAAAYLLADLYEKQGKMDQALALFKRTHAREMEVLTTQNLQAMGDMQARTEHDNARLETASMQKRVASAVRNRNLALGSLAFVLVAGGALGLRMQGTNHRLRGLQGHDPLTGLLGRQEAQRLLLEQAPRADGTQSALLLISVDRFRQINDSHGIAEGDRILTMLGQWLQAECTREDIVSRWGDSDYLVARPHATRADALALAERLRYQIEQHVKASSDPLVRAVTVSFGIAPFPFAPGETHGSLDETLSIANRTLGAVKHSGGNGWAAIWGEASARDKAIVSLLDDPVAADASGMVTLSSNRPLQWPALRASDG